MFANNEAALPFRLVLSVGCLLLAPGGSASARSSTLGSALAKIGAYAPRALAEQGTPGMVLVVTDRRRTLRIYPVGYADLATKTPVTDGSRFGMASITKSITATALLELRDEGKFDPRKPVTAYLPWFAARTKYQPITSHDLFTHTSGIVSDTIGMGDAAVYEVREWATGFAPGTQWSYSNVGYRTLGAELERLDHATYPEIMRRRVWGPLGMYDTTSDQSPVTLRSAATGYLFRVDDRPTPQHPQLMAAPTRHYVDPAGSTLTTGGDFAKYMRFLLDGGVTDRGRRLLSKSSYALLTSPAVTNGRKVGASPKTSAYHFYSYGLAVDHIAGDKVLVHTGGALNYTSCMEVDVTRGFAVMAVSNLGDSGNNHGTCPIVSYARRVLHAHALHQPLPDPPAAIDPRHVARASEYAGTYHSAHETLQIRSQGHRLTLDAPGVYGAALYERGDDSFWVESPRYSEYLLEFGRNDRGKIVEVFYGPQWFTNGAYRGPAFFHYPAVWNEYVGCYQNYDVNANYFSERVFVRKGRLMRDDDEPLTALGNGVFRVGEESWSPERMIFDQIAGGKAGRARQPEIELYRTQQ